MTTDGGGQWSCNTCTFFNKPLFLSCEMCGQAKTAQRPSPPRRQLSNDPDDVEVDAPYDCMSPEIEDFVDAPYYRNGNSSFHRMNDSGNFNDRTPRQVRRNHSNISTLSSGIQGTLIMTDDPADYERQDGKKYGEGEDAEEEYEQDQQRRREDDPALDESMERHLLERERPRDRFQEAAPRFTTPQSHHHRRQPQLPNERPQRQLSSSTRESLAYSQRSGQSAGGGARKPYSHEYSSTTLPTHHMGSSSRILEDECSHEDDISDISGFSSHEGSHNVPNHRFPQQQTHHIHQPLPTSIPTSRRHLMNDRSNASSMRMSMNSSGYQQQLQHSVPSVARRPVPEIHWQQRNGLPVITSAPTTRHSLSVMGDNSSGSHFSQGGNSSRLIPCSPASTSRGTRRPVAGQTAMSMRNLGSQQQQPQQPQLRRGTSVAALPKTTTDTTTIPSDFLPSIKPPPVPALPTLNSPTEVNVMEVFAKDQQAAEKRASVDHSRRRKSTDKVRKDRASMFDNLSKNNAITSGGRSTAGSSSMGSSRRLSQTSSRELLPPPPPPSEMIDIDEALDSPNTRKQRSKERRKMKGAVRGLMATMRLSNK